MTPADDPAPHATLAADHPLHSISMPSEEQAWRLEELVILVLTAILYFARIGARALWSSEFRWAEIAREMLLTHNYFWPTINGHVYYDKPLGSYWLVLFLTPVKGGLTEGGTTARTRARG